MRKAVLVGYAKPETFDKTTGIAKPAGYIEKKFPGILQRLNPHPQGNDKVNDDLGLNMSFSYVASERYLEEAHQIRYVIVNGSKWKVTAIEEKSPRLILQIGALYNDK